VPVEEDGFLDLFEGPVCCAALLFLRRNKERRLMAGTILAAFHLVVQITIPWGAKPDLMIKFRNLKRKGFLDL
jgi:hypothetical protein